MSEEERKVVYSDSYYVLTIRNKYVDLNDIDNPIKDHYLSYPVQNVSGGIGLSLKLVRNEVILEDSFWPSLFEPKTIKFNSIEIASEAVTKDNVFGYELTLSDEIHQYRRQVLSFLEVTGIIGGIFELFEILFGFIVGIYSSQVFKNDISKKFNQTDKEVYQLRKSLNRIKQRIKIEDENENEDVQEENKVQAYNLQEEEKKDNSMVLFQDSLRFQNTEKLEEVSKKKLFLEDLEINKNKLIKFEEEAGQYI
mmetsp:Transcript_18122/g.16033  ORF Transcript_18122/g.16033 Transcript_18122/m.16033 type:complete len:252 (-) Transcript_18122:425-1180(-)